MERLAEKLFSSNMSVLSCTVDESSKEIVAFQANTEDLYSVYSQKFKSNIRLPGESLEDKFRRIINELRSIEIKINQTLNSV
jgi:hypothetical protein